MPGRGSYPSFLVKRFGMEKMRKLLSPNIQKPYASKSRPLQEKVTAFVEKHNCFRIGTCAKHCSASKQEILPFLQSRVDIQMYPDGTCMRIAGIYHGKKAS